MDMSAITVGLNVDIQRSDGRIHSAVVSGVSEDTQSVTVEWFENGETKGKEIEIETILKLNPELLSVPVAEPTVVVPKKPKNAVDDAAAARRSKIAVPARNGRQSAVPARPVSSNASVMAEYGDEQGDLPTGLPQIRKNGGAAAGAPLSANAINAAAAAAPSAANKESAARRKSHCVKEVEKIKQAREERRVAVANMKENVAASKIDKTNPNWAFLQMIEEYREGLEYKPLRGDDIIEDHQICVCVRKRPLNKKELDRRDVDVVTVPNRQGVVVHEPKLKVDLTKYLENQAFRFDYSFDETSTNELVYRYTAQPLVSCIFERGMATCFAYGQTGSGKTHTMGGEFVGKGQQDVNRGIYALSARDVFHLLQTKYKKSDLVVSVSFFEIYSGKVFDLLGSKAKLRILEDGKGQVQVVGLKEEPVDSPEEVMRLLQHGAQARTSGQTSANQHSSRSHAIFQLILRKNVKSKPLWGKFSLIDLAGNERGADTSSADRQTRMEGAEINKSLLALKECIRALGRRGAHLPFRASKLTLVLRDSFVGDNAKTCMIATISPSNSCCEHTLNTLRYADRVKELGPAASGGAAAPSGDDRPPEGDDMSFADDKLLPASPQNHDLALLRTANREEVTDELLSFHAILSHMQELEEELVDEHKSTSELTSVWVDEDRKLLKMTEQVDCDMELYARQLNSVLDKRIAMLTKLREKVTNFRQDLDTEESISRKIKVKKP